MVSSHVAYFLNVAARLTIDQTEANVNDKGFNIFGHGQPDHLIPCVKQGLYPINVSESVSDP